MRLPTSPALLGLLLAACQASGVKYDLQITPIAPANQQPFAGLDRLDVTVEPSRGQPQTYTLDGVSGTPQVTGLEALEEVRISVAGYSGDTLRSFGRTQLLSIDSGAQTVEVLFAEVDTFAWLDVLPIEAGLSAAAPDGQGGFWIFGGVDSTYGSRYDELDTVVYLPLAPPTASLSFTTSSATLPPYTGYVDEESYTGRSGHTATLLTGSAPGAGDILIAGGSAGYSVLETVSSQALLFDPQTETFTELPPLNVPRANHLAVETQAGDVVLLGGLKFTDPGLIETTDTVEVYSRASGTFTVVEGRLPLDGYFGAAVNLPGQGVLHCGGASLADPWQATEDCVIVRSSYEMEDVAPMPAPLARLAMAVTGSGKVLVTGGLEVVRDDGLGIFEVLDASDAAFLYDPVADAWEDVGPLNLARAHHVASPLPDGRVLIAGGAQATSLFYADAVDGAGPALACVEVYSEEAGFELLDGCTPEQATSTLPTSTVSPALAYDPLYGVLLAGGTNLDSAGLSAAALWVSSP